MRYEETPNVIVFICVHFNFRVIFWFTSWFTDGWWVCTEGDRGQSWNSWKDRFHPLDYTLMLRTYGNIITPAVVCYAADRNELRSRVIQWLQTEVVPDGWFVKGSNFSEILLKYFKVGFFSLLDCRQIEWTLVSISAHSCSFANIFIEYPGLFICVDLLLKPPQTLIIHVTDHSSLSADGFNSI